LRATAGARQRRREATEARFTVVEGVGATANVSAAGDRITNRLELGEWSGAPGATPPNATGSAGAATGPQCPAAQAQDGRPRPRARRASSPMHVLERNYEENADTPTVLGVGCVGVLSVVDITPHYH